MKRENLHRRDFNELTMAAFGGVVAGTIAGCGGGDEADSADGPAAGGESGTSTPEADGDEGNAVTQVSTNDWTGDVHVCRGLNACEGKGAGGDNACAGQGTCATAAAHACHEMNECKFQGGCGESVGTNACKGQGECNVPLTDATWTRAREKFEAAMEAAGKAVGAAPPKA